MRLWSITIMLKTPQSGCRLLYRSVENSFTARAKLTALPAEGGVEVTDDYGNSYCVDLSQIASVLLTDMAQECEGVKEMQMLQAHRDADLYDRMSKDDVIQKYARAQRGNVMPSNMILGANGRGPQ